MRSAQSKVRREVNKANRELSSSVRQYNQAVRSYNTKVKQDRARINRELQKFSKSSATTQYTISVRTLNTSYQQVSARYDNIDSPTDFENIFYSSIEQENANSIATANVLANQPSEPMPEPLTDTEITDQLIYFSPDLDKRWKGALYSLSPDNPDATRHFCTSSREIFSDLLELKAKDKDVFERYPDCEKTDRGNATRRWKIKYLLNKKGINHQEVEDFVEKDISNILELFHTLSDGTHGEAGKYDDVKLHSVKKRVEDGIIFLSTIARDSP